MKRKHILRNGVVKVELLMLLSLLQQTIKADLIGFWPLNCDFYGRDASSSPAIHMRYDRPSPTAPRFECTAQHGLRGAASFSIFGDALSFKFLQADNPGSAALGLGSGFTWLGYMKVSLNAFTDVHAPIFSFEKPQSETDVDAGLGLEWANSALILVVSGTDGRWLRTVVGTGMNPDRWYKVAVSANFTTGLLVQKVIDVGQNLVTSRISYTMPASGIVPYTNGQIRFGAYVHSNNNGNYNFFRGRLSCVRLYNHAMTMTDINAVLTVMPGQCSTSGVSVNPCENSSICANEELVPQPGYASGICQLDGDSYSCVCEAGYEYDGTQNICKDIDESRQDNCGCDDVCENKYMDRDGMRFQCICTENNQALSVDGFSCIETIPFSATPLYGPEAGGTTIVIAYGFLANTERSTFPNVVVKLGRIRIRPVNVIDDTHISVTTPPHGDGDSLTSDVPRGLSVTVQGDEVSSAVFIYKPNPVIVDVYPLQTILAGGTLLTVTGSHMDSVSQPKLLVTGIPRSVVSVDATSTTSTSTVCDVESDVTMACPMPPLLLDEARRRRRGASSEERELAEMFIGFQLDGVPTYRNLSESLPDRSRVTVYMNPEFQPFKDVLKYDPDKGERLDIEGNNMDTGATAGDYRIMLEDTECGDMDMVSNLISCLPPEKEPKTSTVGASDKGKIRINVHVGYYDFYIGQMEYVKSSPIDSNLALIIGASAGGAIFVIVIVIVSVICYIKCKRSAEAKRKYKEKVKAGKDGRHFDNAVYKTDFQNNHQDYDNFSAKAKSEISQFRMSQNMFVQNDKQLMSNGKTKRMTPNVNDKKSRKETAKEEKYYADMMSNTSFPALKKDKDGIVKKNTYTESPSRGGLRPANGYLELLGEPTAPTNDVRLPYKKGQAPPMPRTPAR